MTDSPPRRLRLQDVADRVGVSAKTVSNAYRNPDQLRPELRQQILGAVGYTMAQQVRPESDFAVVPAADGLGAVPSNPLDRKVRIDFVQHVCSAMIRAATVP